MFPRGRGRHTGEGTQSTQGPHALLGSDVRAQRAQGPVLSSRPCCGRVCEEGEKDDHEPQHD